MIINPRWDGITYEISNSFDYKVMTFNVKPKGSLTIIFQDLWSFSKMGSLCPFWICGLYKTFAKVIIHQCIRFNVWIGVPSWLGKYLGAYTLENVLLMFLKYLPNFQFQSRGSVEGICICISLHINIWKFMFIQDDVRWELGFPNHANTSL